MAYTALRRSLLALLLLLAGCRAAPAVRIIPHPTAQALTVRASAALQDLRPDFTACADEEKINLVLLDSPGAAGERADLDLRWLNAPAGEQVYTYVLDHDELLLAGNAANSAARLDLETVKAAFQGRPGPYHVYTYPRGTDMQSVVESFLQVGNEAAAPAEAGTGGGKTYLAPDPQAMREALEADPLAIGFLPGRWLDAALKAIPIDGARQAIIPILASSAAEPQGAARGWLLCLQDRLARRTP